MISVFPINYRQALALGTLLAAAAGCSVSEQRQEGGKFPVTSAVPAAPSQRQQLKAVRTFAKTTFQLAAVEEVRLAGVDIPAAANNSLPPSAPASELKAAASGTGAVPLHLRLRLEARNPNRDKVLLNQLEYLVLVDGREVATGSTDNMLEIEPRSTLSIPLTLDANVREALAAGLAPETLASALGTWNRPSARLRVHVRPTFQNATGRAFRTTDFEPIEVLVAGR
ncbi:hypothetical protein [uncultured Hymenobacter sp.]|uniref:hypothetical protein n=1 Tax=uncultured Hymenobacter sp. TaxID=170016 RepID=UPI0035CBD011